jgi:hypothetical protein
MSVTRPLLLFAAIGLSQFVGGSACQAQQPIRRFQPNTPTISPYLNLLRNDNAGGLPNYYSLVRPQMQQNSFNARQGAFNQQQLSFEAQQTAAVGDLSSQVQPLIAPTGKAAQFMTPGRSSGFMNTSRYYSQPMQRGGGRR